MGKCKMPQVSGGALGTLINGLSWEYRAQYDTLEAPQMVGSEPYTDVISHGLPLGTLNASPNTTVVNNAANPTQLFIDEQHVLVLYAGDPAGAIKVKLCEVDQRNGQVYNATPIVALQQPNGYGIRWVRLIRTSETEAAAFITFDYPNTATAVDDYGIYCIKINFVDNVLSIIDTRVLNPTGLTSHNGMCLADVVRDPTTGNFLIAYTHQGSGLVYAKLVEYTYDLNQRVRFSKSWTFYKYGDYTTSVDVDEPYAYCVRLTEVDDAVLLYFPRYMSGTIAEDNLHLFKEGVLKSSNNDFGGGIGIAISAVAIDSSKVLMVCMDANSVDYYICTIENDKLSISGATAVNLHMLKGTYSAYRQAELYKIPNSNKFLLLARGYSKNTSKRVDVVGMLLELNDSDKLTKLSERVLWSMSVSTTNTSNGYYNQFLQITPYKYCFAGLFNNWLSNVYIEVSTEDVYLAGAHSLSLNIDGLQAAWVADNKVAIYYQDVDNGTYVLRAADVGQDNTLTLGPALTLQKTNAYKVARINRIADNRFACTHGSYFKIYDIAEDNSLVEVGSYSVGGQYLMHAFTPDTYLVQELNKLFILKMAEDGTFTRTSMEVTLGGTQYAVAYKLTDKSVLVSDNAYSNSSFRASILTFNDELTAIASVVTVGTSVGYCYRASERCFNILDKDSNGAFSALYRLTLNESLTGAESCIEDAAASLLIKTALGTPHALDSSDYSYSPYSHAICVGQQLSRVCTESLIRPITNIDGLKMLYKHISLRGGKALMLYGMETTYGTDSTVKYALHYRIGKVEDVLTKGGFTHLITSKATKDLYKKVTVIGGVENDKYPYTK